MPHLSPMNWIMAIIMFWLSLSLIMSSTWWLSLSNSPFKLPTPSKLNKMHTTWKWNW